MVRKLMSTTTKQENKCTKHATILNDVEPNIQYKKVSALWKEFKDSTTFHGISELSFETESRKGTFRSICWFVMWLSCTTYLTYTIFSELKLYYSYPTYSYTQINFDDELIFPAITVCNLSPRNKSAFKNTTKTVNFQMSFSAMYFYSNTINWQDSYYSDEGYFNKRTLQDIYAESKDFVVFDNEEKKNLFRPVLTDMGVCVRANSDESLKTTKHGALFNLQLFINVMLCEDYFGSSLSSGVKYKFLPPPYKAFSNKTCLDDQSYSVSICHRDCWNKIIQHVCGCNSIFFQITGNSSYCSYFKHQNCTSTLFWTLVTSKSDLCNCPLKCQYTEYDYTVSTGKYPSDFLVNQIASQTNIEAEFVRENFVLVRIYYKDLRTTITEQIPKYENYGAIFANLGGQLGLFLGASILSITELMEFLLFLGWYIVQRCRKTKKQSDSRPQTFVVKQT